MTFEQWTTKLDRMIQNIAGCSLNDLADCNTRDMFDDGMPPAAAALEVLEENGFDPAEIM